MTAPVALADDKPITLAELLTLGATLVVAALGTSSLLLAQLSSHSAAGALGLAALLLAPIVVWFWRERLPVRWAPRDLVLAVVLGAIGLVMFLPGFPYAFDDKDPGVYVVHSWAIAREGSVTIEDPVLEAGLPGALFTPGVRFPGIWTEGTDHVTSQFFHFFSSLAATGIDLFGQSAVFHLSPLLGALSIVAFGLGVRRAFGSVTALVAGGLLAISMPQVWQAKYPSTEVLAQLLMMAALLALVVAIETRSRSVAFLAGVLVGTGFLARPDGLLLVLLAVGVGAALLALDRFDGRARSAAAGLAISLPYPLYNAYHLRRSYTLSNEVPDWPVVVAAMVGVLVLGRVLRRPICRAWDRIGPVLVARRRWLGIVPALVLALMLFGFFARGRWGAPAYTDLLGPEPIRSYDEKNLRRLTYFLTPAIVPLAVAGLAVVGWQRWRVVRWAILIPGLAMTPLYLWEAQISPRMMWWVRRFVPGVIPLLVLLAAVAIGWALQRRQWALRIAGAVVLIGLGSQLLTRSWPLRDHREYAGSYSAAERIAAVTERGQGLFLWQRPGENQIFDANRNLAAVVWFGFDQMSALLPPDPTQQSVDDYAERFPEQEIYVVSTGPALPGSLDPDRFDEVGSVTTRLPLWEESLEARPDHAISIPINAVVWQYDHAAPSGG